jgi:hypothetical protein
MGQSERNSRNYPEISAKAGFTDHCGGIAAGLHAGNKHVMVIEWKLIRVVRGSAEVIRYLAIVFAGASRHASLKARTFME